MNTSAAARDLSTDAASLRIDRDPQTRLRGSHYRPERWVGPVLLLSALIVGWWCPDSLIDKTRVQEASVR